MSKLLCRIIVFLLVVLGATINYAFLNDSYIFGYLMGALCTLFICIEED